MECAVGNFGGDIRQPSNPFANLCQIALRRSQVNALKAIYPELDRDAIPHLPKHAQDAGNGYILLTPRDRYHVKLQGAEEDAVHDAGLDMSKVRRWGRLCLPNGQISRSNYSESRRSPSNQRISRNVNVCIFNSWLTKQIIY